jgi:hypothetical protein
MMGLAVFGTKGQKTSILDGYLCSNERMNNPISAIKEILAIIKTVKET